MAMRELIAHWPVFFLCAIGVPVAYYIRCSLRRAQSFPPGPRVSWFNLWGKSVNLPTSYPWLTYAKWQETYGDIIYFNMFRNPVLVLNSAQATQDLLEKRSAIYSSRPVRTMQSELVGFSFMFTGMPYNAWYKEHRNLFHKYFQPKAVPTYYPVQLKHAHTLLRNLASNPNALEHHIQRTTAAVVLEICYGHPVADKGDEYVTLADKALAGLSRTGTFGTYMVDYLPILKHVPAWMPGAAFKRQAREWRTHALGMLNYPFDMVKRRLENGTAEPSIMTAELEDWFRSGKQSGSQQEELIKNVTATSYVAGSDTNLSVLSSFFLAMALHPEIQMLAQAQIDAAVPPDRLPGFSDRDKLPFLDCIIWESLRWNPAVNIAIAHYLTKDDEYRGYNIPKGTTVLGNIWAILHDPAVYPEPMRFDPYRFAYPAANIKRGINPLPEAAFGFGRRACPGRYLALDTIWIVVASVLAAYSITKPLDRAGREFDPPVAYTSGLISRPVPFSCRITPRSAQAAALVQQTGDVF